ncbi:MAG: SPOR domain-containing protein [Pseudomonadota bacterium]
MMTKNTRRFELKLGRIGLILFLLSMSGLLFGVFLLGVTVGKNIDTYPEKIARFLPDRIKTLISRLLQDATTPSVAMRDDLDLKQEKPEPDMGLTFYDRLGKRKAGPKGMAPDGMILQKAPVAAVKEKPPSPQATQPTEPKSPGPAPAVQKEPPIKEKSTPQGKFMVQVVSYQGRSKAEALVKKIAAMGYAVRTEVTELPDKGKWFRVVMGEFSSRPEAQKAVDAVSRKTKGLSCVIRSVDGPGN